MPLANPTQATTWEIYLEAVAATSPPAVSTATPAAPEMPSPDPHISLENAVEGFVVPKSSLEANREMEEEEEEEEEGEGEGETPNDESVVDSNGGQCSDPNKGFPPRCFFLPLQLFPCAFQFNINFRRRGGRGDWWVVCRAERNSTVIK